RAKPKPVRYEHDEPGDLVHVDVKKLGRIPDGGGHRAHGRAQGHRVKKGAKPRTACVHNDLDDHSRLAYSEVLPDETKETTAAFVRRAKHYLARCGIHVMPLLIDRVSPYRPNALAPAMSQQDTQQRFRRYRPQFHGRVEQFNRTL